EIKKGTLEKAALKVGVSQKTARKYIKQKRLPNRGSKPKPSIFPILYKYFFKFLGMKSFGKSFSLRLASDFPLLKMSLIKLTATIRGLFLLSSLKSMERTKGLNVLQNDLDIL
ncbi:MAG: hypothetical protein K0R24_1922, partial [Gammaproteobacteria bacterium]|nr:hypothetical protein [Gammaproteobacteria bacterium]